MGFIALIVALLIEQGRSLPADNWVHRMVLALADLVRSSTDAGQRQHGLVGFVVLAVVMLAVVLVLDWLAGMVHPALRLLVHIAVLYFTLGFRQFSQTFTEMQVALAADDTPGARRVLDRWVAHNATDEGAERPERDTSVHEICRRAIAHALVGAHRNVFGPLFWYVVLPGAIGPVLYRLAELLSQRWSKPASETPKAARAQAAGIGVPAVAIGRSEPEPYGLVATVVYQVLDWLPVRLSAAGFAIMGNFEDAIYCWRGAVSAGTGREQRALLLAAGGGALGLRVAEPELEARWASGEHGFEFQGVLPDASGLRSGVGLVWRSVLLWLGLYAMLTLAAWLGR